MVTLKQWQRLIIAVLIAAGMLTACSRDEDKDQGNVFESQTQALDKARQLDGQLKDSAERTRQRIEEQR